MLHVFSKIIKIIKNNFPKNNEIIIPIFFQKIITYFSVLSFNQ